MADGTTKEIQDIQSGDTVLSYDLKTGTPVTDTVGILYIHPNIPGGYLVINGKLRVTGNHNVWSVNRREWIHAQELEVGDSLLNPQGQPVRVDLIEKVEGSNTLYNLGLTGENRNYFTEDILVHNWKL